ncbi:MAG: hypothetical protein ABI852_02755 [Gemmatimonadaceae bacterium]
MKHSRISVSLVAVLSVFVASACDSPGAPNQTAPMYDLLYSTVASATLLIQPFEGGPPVPLGFGIGMGLDPVATADGRYVAYAKIADNGGTSISLVDRVTGTKTDLTNGVDIDQQPAISPDGSRIVFVSSRDVGENIYIMNRDGSNQMALTIEPLPLVIVDRSPSWSPDGRQISWSSSTGGFLTIWIMNADGSNKHRLTNSTTAFEDDAAWSPDGTRIAYFEVMDVTPRLVVVNVDGTNRRVLPTPPNGHSQDPAWSPDGKLLAFTFNPDDHSRPSLYTMKPDGSELQQRLHDDQNRGVRRASFIRR